MAFPNELTFRQVTALRYAADAGAYGDYARDKIAHAVGLAATRSCSAAESSEEAAVYWTTAAARTARLAIEWLTEDSVVTIRCCQTIDGCTSCACQIFDPAVPMEAAP